MPWNRKKSNESMIVEQETNAKKGLVTFAIFYNGYPNKKLNQNFRKLIKASNGIELETGEWTYPTETQGIRALIPKEYSKQLARNLKDFSEAWYATFPSLEGEHNA